MRSLKKRKDPTGALAAVLVLLCLALLWYHRLSGTDILAPNAYDSYTLQVRNWLEGRFYIENGEYYTWLELATFEGKYYQSFPPVPGLVLLPWVILFGAKVPADLVILLLAVLAAAGVYACFVRAGHKPVRAAFFALFCSMGSNLFWLSCSGGVWFMAQVCGFCFAVWGIFFALADDLPGRGMASLCFALAVGCRPFYALLLGLWALYKLADFIKDKNFSRLAAAAWPALAVAGVLAWYNYARFGSVLEFGHNWLPEFLREEEGQFSLVYLLPNLKNLLRWPEFDLQNGLQFPVFNGFAFYLANPLYLLWGLQLVLAKGKEGKIGLKNTSIPTCSGVIVLVFCLWTAVTCMHRTLGGWQFGARYMVDMIPLVLCWFLGRDMDKTPNAFQWLLCGAAVVLNLYGAVYMLG